MVKYTSQALKAFKDETSKNPFHSAQWPRLFQWAHKHYSHDPTGIRRKQRVCISQFMIHAKGSVLHATSEHENAVYETGE